MAREKAAAQQAAPFLRFAPLLLEICFFVHLSSALVGWDHKLDDYHGFRQCQTAISAYYTIKDGFHLAYETPVLGKPWSIPLEFPLYQWIVAAAVMVFHTPLDQTGRFFSLFFFYLTLLPVYYLLKFVVESPPSRLFLLSFILINPTYLFWSRTFLIESLALFLGVLFLAAVAWTLEKPHLHRLILAAVVGSLAGWVKATTFCVFCMPCGLLLARSWWKEGDVRFRSWSLGRYLWIIGMVLAIPLGATLGWLVYTDQLKSLNPLAFDLLSLNKKWNLGTWPQRISPDVWSRIVDNSHLAGLTGGFPWTNGISPFFWLIAFAATFLIPGRRKERFLFLAGFIFPLLVFINLYFVHDYYFYANSLFLSIFIGLTLLSIFERFGHQKGGWMALVLIPLLFVSSYRQYLSSYPLFFPTRTETLSGFLKAHTAPGDILLMYGFDWDSTIPYYSQRRALMDREDLSLDDPKMKKALELLGNDQIGAMFIRGTRSPDFIRERVTRFGLDPKPVDLGIYHLYVKRSQV